MGRVGHHERGGKGFSQQVFDDDSTTFCPCGATFNSSSSWDDTSAYSKWEAVHRPHLDDKRGTMAGALAKAEAYSKKLTTIDTRFQHAVHLVHADGTSMFLSHAFTVTWKEFVIVFAEHHGYFTYDKEDLTSCTAYAEIPKSTEESIDG